MRRAVLVVPPMVKSLAGPLAAPAWLAGVASSEGARLDVVDLNARWLRWGHPIPLPDPGGPSGDHAKPLGGLSLPARTWRAVVETMVGSTGVERGCEEGGLRADFQCLDTAATRLGGSWLGRVWTSLLGDERPRFVGLSILWEGQVLAALAVSILAKRRWPGVPVIWGGAHVTALAPEIVDDSRYGWNIDGFVAGYAEGTFRSMLRGEPLAAPGVFQAGQLSAVKAVEELDSIPWFHDVHLYGRPRLTLPIQTARGCAYAKCAFCTYPAVEGGFRRLDDAAVAAAVDRSVGLGAEIAMRDAFATPARLDLMSGLVAGRTRFAATTRLVPRLGRARLKAMVRAGLHTLELGVEAVDREVLRLVAKRQAPGAVEGWLADAAGLDLHLVLNVMFGYPGQTLAGAKATRSHFDVALRRRFPRTRFTIERNLLQLERRSPMASDPAAYGMSILGSAPWSSVLSWNAPTWRPVFELRTPLLERLRSA